LQPLRYPAQRQAGIFDVEFAVMLKMSPGNSGSKQKYVLMWDPWDA
jgi:hypothetical protein